MLGTIVSHPPLHSDYLPVLLRQSRSKPLNNYSVNTAITELQIRCASFEARLDSVTQRLDQIPVNQESITTFLKRLTSKQASLQHALETLTTRMDTIANCLTQVCYSSSLLTTLPPNPICKPECKLRRPQLIFLQEAFTGHRQISALPYLLGYHSYFHATRHCLLTYIHTSLSHHYDSGSTLDTTTYQSFTIDHDDSISSLYNIHCSPSGFITEFLPYLPLYGSLYIGDLNACHASLGDSSCDNNRNGRRLLQYIQTYHITPWSFGGATHIRGGSLDHIPHLA